MLDFFKKFKEIIIFFGGIIGFLFLKNISDKSKDKKIEKISSANNNLEGKNTVIKENIASVSAEIKDTDKEIIDLKKEIKAVDSKVVKKENSKKFFKDRGF